MVKIGTIKKIFKGKKLLICSYVSNNSPLKSQFFRLIKTKNGDKIIIGKGVTVDGKILKLGLNKYSLYSYVFNSSFVWIGIGEFIEEIF